MAKRVPKDEKPYRPVDEGLVRSVISGQAVGGASEGQAALALAEPATTEPIAPPAPRLARATEPVSDDHTSSASSVAENPLERKKLREKRMLLTRQEERELERLVTRLGAEVCSSLKLSHVLRACVTLLLHGEDVILEHGKCSPELLRPANGNAAEIARFEKQVAHILMAGLRDARPLR